MYDLPVEDLHSAVPLEANACDDGCGDTKAVQGDGGKASKEANIAVAVFGFILEMYWSVRVHLRLLTCTGVTNWGPVSGECDVRRCCSSHECTQGHVLD